MHANTLSVFEARGVASGVPMQAFRMGGVEAPQAPRSVGSGEGIPPPHWGKGLWRWLCPLPRKFFVFFVGNTIF